MNGDKIRKLWPRIERGDPTPSWDNRPLPPEDLEWVWSAYRELATCTGGMGGAIPWTAIHAYAERYGMSLSDEEELLSYVRAIESAEHEEEE